MDTGPSYSGRMRKPRHRTGSNPVGGIKMSIYEYAEVIAITVFIVIIFLWCWKLFHDLEHDEDRNEV